VEFGVGPLTVAEGRVAFGSGESEVRVVRATDGEVLWSRNLGHLVAANPPALAYGNVYVQVVNHLEDTWLWALDAATGARVFRSPFDSQWQSYLAPTLFDGKVYVDGGYGDGMYAFDAYTGDRLWFTQLPQFDRWTPAVDEDHAYAYVGGGLQAGLYRLDRSSGGQDLFIADPDFEDPSGGMWQAPVLGGRNNVVSTNGHRLLSFDLASGTLSTAALGQAWYQASVDDGMIHVVDTGRLRVFDEETLSEVWSWEEPGPWLQSPLIVAGRYVFAKKGDETLAIDRTTHQVAWRYPVGGSLAVAEGRLFIGAPGRLFAFATRAVSPTSFYTVPPCRLMDTRAGSEAPVGGPALAAGSPRSVSTAGRCGIPLSAKALAVNVTAIGPTSNGFVQIDAAMGSPGAFSTLALRAGSTRAAHATVSALDGQLFATLDAPAGATTDLLIDVSGYFE
jgi:outer membrane protein assembly factor BamB